MNKYLCKTFIKISLTIFLFVLSGCPNKLSDASLPKDILGISLEMKKDAAQKRLEEIAVFERSENKGQQVWRLKDISRFVILSVGYDAENEIRYVAGIINEKGSQKLRYADVGDLSSSKQNVSQGNYEYIWDVPEGNNLPAHQVTAHGNNPEYLMILTLKKNGADSDEEEEERERK